MQTLAAGGRAMRALAWVVLTGLAAAAWAQTAPGPRKRPAPAPAASAPARPAAAAAATPAVVPAVRSGKGWKVGPLPAWVVDPPAASADLPRAPDAGARRDLLVDLQGNFALARPQVVFRLRTLARDASALGQVSQTQINFNPDYQTVGVHAATVIRDGQRLDRLPEARIELMRREQRLEQLVIDGQETLLVMLTDVRVGDAVEIAYSVEGQNPIFEDRLSWEMRTAQAWPTDLVHHRLMAPASRALFTKSVGGELAAERKVDGKLQILTLVRQQVPALQQEAGTPPWVVVQPVLDISEYGSWADVDAWAQRLFALPATTAPTVAAKARSFRDQGLQGAELVSEVLRFVQDDVRYFSVSLGTSSHRPKPPEQTLAERVGDCKDKVTLFNALMRELGIPSRPALVSMRRLRGVSQFLPSPEVFDHVIAQVELDGQAWYLDPTVQGQGLVLSGRGQFPYGLALVVGAGSTLTAVPESEATMHRLEFEQRWNLTQPGLPVQMEFSMRAHGALAERWRALLAQVGAEQLANSVAGGFTRSVPGLQTSGPPRVEDDRSANRLSFQQSFTVAQIGTYGRGALEVEFVAPELVDLFFSPQELRRRLPLLQDQPRRVDSTVVVDGPLRFAQAVPAPIEVVDRHFRYSARLEAQGSRVVFHRRFERRLDEVQPVDLTPWREKLNQAQQTLTGRLRVPLVDFQELVPELQAAERRQRSVRGARQDQLSALLTRYELDRIVTSRVLDRLPPGQPLTARVLTARAMSLNLLGLAAESQADASKALSTLPDDADALEALAVSQLQQGRVDESLSAFERIQPQSRPPAIASWMGAVLLLQGRFAEAEAQLRHAVAGSSGEAREFALVWLYLAAERQGGRGKAAVADEVPGTDPKRLSGAILRHMVGELDRDALLKQAGEPADAQRLNLAEANYFIGGRLAAQGQRDEALTWFRRAVDTGATPYREVMFARLELQRAGR